jgi:hypothetical protein
MKQCRSHVRASVGRSNPFRKTSITFSLRLLTQNCPPKKATSHMRFLRRKGNHSQRTSPRMFVPIPNIMPARILLLDDDSAFAGYSGSLSFRVSLPFVALGYLYYPVHMETLMHVIISGNLIRIIELRSFVCPRQFKSRWSCLLEILPHC